MSPWRPRPQPSPPAHTHPLRVKAGRAALGLPARGAQCWRCCWLWGAQRANRPCRLQVHPDKVTALTEAEQKLANEAFKLLSLANTALKQWA